MKKFLKGRIFLLAVCLGLVWVVTAGIAFGLTAVTRSLNATVNIRANSDFAFFSDAAASQLMTQVSLPEVEPGEESTFTVYVKNTSTVAETLTAGPNSVPPQVGTLTLSFDGQASKTLAPGAITRVVGTLTVLQTAESGPLNFSFSINAVQAAYQHHSARSHHDCTADDNRSADNDAGAEWAANICAELHYLS